jgi:hypothetical protein
MSIRNGTSSSLDPQPQQLPAASPTEGDPAGTKRGSRRRFGDE